MTQIDADQNSSYPHAELSHRVIGCFYRVYSTLGFGFLETVYERALVLELQSAGLNASAQVPIQVAYRGHIVGDYRADVLVEDRLLLELKAVRQLEPAMDAQVLNYLKATGLTVALLLNFGPEPQVRRLVYDTARHAQASTP